MHAAVVTAIGKIPAYAGFREPAPTAGKSILRVEAAALTHLTRGRASGTHYTSVGELPFVPGVDGVGTHEDGRRVYFLMPEKPFGAMAERVLVDDANLVPVPYGLDAVTAAALANPGMSSWAALTERAHLRAGETVLVNGATGTSGRLAIQIAKHLGAKKVIATGRRHAIFDELRALGADVTVTLTQARDTLLKAFETIFRDGVDVVLDYLWGDSAEVLIAATGKASPPERPIRFVQIGSMGGATVAMHAHALRASGLQLLGSGFGSLSLAKLLDSIRGVLQAAPSAGFKIATQAVPLADVADAWQAPETASRIVLTP